MGDFMELMGILLFGMIGIALLVIGVAYPVETYACNKYGEVTGQQSKLVFLECYVNVDDQWVHRNQIRYLNGGFIGIEE